MILRLARSADAARSVEYVTGQAGAVRIGGNMAGVNAAELVGEFQLVMALQRSRRHAIRHLALRLAPDEHLADHQWCAVVERLLCAFCCWSCPYVVYRHRDSGHGHVHVLACEISYFGRCQATGPSLPVVAQVKARIERDYGLRPTENLGVGALTGGEARRPPSGAPAPLTRRLQSAIAAAARAATGCSSYFAELRRRGVEVLPLLTAGAALHAMVYELDGRHFRDHRLGPLFRWRELERSRGWRFDPVRDLPLALAARDRFTARGRGPRPGNRGDHGGGTRTAGATGAGADPGVAPAAAGAAVPDQAALLATAGSQLAALHSPSFDLMVLDAASGSTRELWLECERDRLLAQLPRLAQDGRSGAEVLIRPAQTCGLVLLTGVRPGRLARARQRGFEAAAVVAASAGADAPCEVWLRGGPAAAALTAGERRIFDAAAARALGTGPPPAAPPFGHLAGLPSPFARRLGNLDSVPVSRLLSATGGVFARAATLAAEARQRARQDEQAARAEAERAAIQDTGAVIAGAAGVTGAAGSVEAAGAAGLAPLDGDGGAAWHAALDDLATRFAANRLGLTLPPRADRAAVEQAVLRLGLARDDHARARQQLAPRCAAARDLAGDLQEAGRLVDSWRRLRQAERAVEDLVGQAPLPPRLAAGEIARYVRQREIALAAAARFHQAAALAATAPGNQLHEAAAAWRSLRGSLNDFATAHGFRPSLPAAPPILSDREPPAVPAAPGAAAAGAAGAPPVLTTRRPPGPEIAALFAAHRHAARRLAALGALAAGSPAARDTAGGLRRRQSALGALVTAELTLESREEQLQRTLRQLVAARDARQEAALAAAPRPRTAPAEILGELTAPGMAAAPSATEGSGPPGAPLAAPPAALNGSIAPGMPAALRPPDVAPAPGVPAAPGVPGPLAAPDAAAAPARASAGLTAPQSRAVVAVGYGSPSRRAPRRQPRSLRWLRRADAWQRELTVALCALSRHRLGRDLERVEATLAVRPSGAALGRAARLLRLAAAERPAPRQTPAHQAAARQRFERAAAELLNGPSAAAVASFRAAGLQVYGLENRAALDHDAAGRRQARAVLRRAGHQVVAALQPPTPPMPPMPAIPPMLQMPRMPQTTPMPPTTPAPPTAPAQRRTPAVQTPPTCTTLPVPGELHAALARHGAAESALALRLDSSPPAAPRSRDGALPGLAWAVDRARRGDLTPEAVNRLAAGVALLASVRLASAESERPAGALRTNPRAAPTSPPAPAPSPHQDPPARQDGRAGPDGCAASLAEYRAARAELLRAARATGDIGAPRAAGGARAVPAWQSVARLGAAVARYQAADADLHRRLAQPALAAHRVLPLAAFLDPEAPSRRPHVAVLTWATHAARQGLPAEQAAAWLARAAATGPGLPRCLATRLTELAAQLGAARAAALSRTAALEVPAP